jgi:hypothetical protein
MEGPRRIFYDRPEDVEPCARRRRDVGDRGSHWNLPRAGCADRKWRHQAGNGVDLQLERARRELTASAWRSPPRAARQQTTITASSTVGAFDSSSHRCNQRTANRRERSRSRCATSAVSSSASLRSSCPDFARLTSATTTLPRSIARRKAVLACPWDVMLTHSCAGAGRAISVWDQRGGSSGSPSMNWSSRECGVSQRSTWNSRAVTPHFPGRSAAGMVLGFLGRSAAIAHDSAPRSGSRRHQVHR